MAKKIIADMFNEDESVNEPVNNEPAGDGDDLSGVFGESKKEEDIPPAEEQKDEGLKIPEEKKPPVEEKKPTVEEKKTPEAKKETKKEEKKEEKKDEVPEFKLLENLKVEDPNKTVIDYVAMAKHFDIDLGDKKEYQAFVDAVRQKIETSKQIVEPDLSKYDDETKKVISFLEKGGTIKDIIEPLKMFDDFLRLNPEEKIKKVWMAEGRTEDEVDEDLNDADVVERELRDYYRDIAKLSKSKITEKIEDLISNDNLFNEHRKLYSQLYDKDINILREEKFKEVVADHDKKILSLQEKDKIQAQAENETLKKIVDSTKDYKGIALSEPVKEYIKSQIDSGEFHKFLDTAEAQLNAYLDLKFREQIESHIKKSVSEASRKGYNSGIEKKTQKLHNMPSVDTSITHDKTERKSALEQAASSMEDGAN